MKPQVIVAFRNFTFAYTGKAPLLEIADLPLSGPGLVAIVGESGTGKSTLIKFIAAQQQLEYGGSITVFGREWRDVQGKSLPKHRRQIGYIPQNYGLQNEKTVRSNLMQDLADANVAANEREPRIHQALQQMGIAEFIDDKVRDLSGGQQQRVAIAKALARKARLVIADEPTANLDVTTTNQVIDALRIVGQQALVIIVTHHQQVADQCDAKLELSKGTPIPRFTSRRPPALPTAPPRRPATTTPPPCPLIAMTSRHPGHVEIWRRDATLHLTHQSRNADMTWSAQTVMPPPSGRPIGSLTGGFTKGNLAHILAVDSKGVAWQRTLHHGSWQPWAKAGIRDVRHVTIAGGGPGRLDWWGTLQDGQLAYRPDAPNPAKSWMKMDIPAGRKLLQIAVGAAAWPQLDLLALDTDGVIWFRTGSIADVHTMSDWQKVALPKARAITVTSGSPHMEIWLVTADGKLLHHTGPTTSPWKRVATPGSQPVIAICGSQQTPQTSDIFIETANGAHWHQHLDGPRWTSWKRLAP